VSDEVERSSLAWMEKKQNRLTRPRARREGALACSLSIRLPRLSKPREGERLPAHLDSCIAFKVTKKIFITCISPIPSGGLSK
jgi:hypothetical protein